MINPQENPVLTAALAHHEFGHRIIPTRENKAPGCGEGWNRWFVEEQTEVQVKELFFNGAYGLGLLLYPASPFIILDFDGPHAHDAWNTTGIDLDGAARVITRSGGHHFIFRTPDETIELDKLKRAIRLLKAACDCKKDGKPKPCGVDFLIHGYAVAPPTPGYSEDPNHPLEDAATIPQEVLALAQERSKNHEHVTGDVNGRIQDGERKATLVSLAGSMRTRGMSIPSIRAALEVDNEHRCVPPLEPNEIEDILASAAKWETGTFAEHLTDLGNARRLVRQHGQDMRYCHQNGWLVWDGRRWACDDTGVVQRYAKDTVRRIYAEATASPDEGQRKAIADHARKSESEARIKAMISLAESESEVVVRHDDLDCDPWLLNVENGTLNLRTDEIRKHKQEDLITRLVSVPYDSNATCLGWLKFLERVTGDNPELIRFFQKAVGYSLTASTREQCFFILYGTGANGKSTFLNIIASLLGDYAKQTRTETLLIKRGDAIPNDIARLACARFVSAVETESGQRLAEGLVKQMTGGDKLTARFLHKEYFEFEPTFKLWLAVNHKPRIQGTDHAVWRRIRLVPFTVTIPETERDPDLGEKLKQDLPGILAWAVQGCSLWKSEGIKPPEAVKAATTEYREESDTIVSFIEECCETGSKCEVTKADLYEGYVEWCKKCGERAVSKREFGIRLVEKGYSDDRTKKGRYWKGLELGKGDAT